MPVNRTYVFDLHVVPAQAALVSLIELLEECERAHEDLTGEVFVPKVKPRLLPPNPHDWFPILFFLPGGGTFGGFPNPGSTG